MYRLGTDVGGTFTDFVLMDETTGEVSVQKVPSTPSQPEQGVLSGIRSIGEKIREVRYFSHGTTVGTNAVLERKGALVGMITTSGMRDVIEIGRQARSKIYDFFVQRPEPLSPRNLRFVVDQRMDAEGRVIKEIDQKQLREVIGRIREKHIESLAICFLFSYINPTHERLVKRMVEEALPAVSISTSSEVLPEYREFERFSTTLLNAYIKPVMNRYISSLESQAKEAGIPGDLYIMQSNGGIMTSAAAVEKGHHALLSGPAAGVVAGAFFGRLFGHQNVITFDMGGTSTDVSLVEDGSPRLTTEGFVGGYPLKVPMIDIHTVGAGGGSIAWIDTGGALRVGPQSAGADPGPACYGKRGTKPTVTDANVVLGYINPDYFLGGRIRLQKGAAEAAVSELGRSFGLDMVTTAFGITEIANSSMAGAIRVISIEKGYDPRDFVLVAFGGAGPVHAGKIAKDLGIPRVIIPTSPGITSALGLLIADIMHDYSTTSILKAKGLGSEKLRSIWKELETRAISTMEEEGVKHYRLKRYCDVRYEGQSFEITIPVDGEDVSKMVKDFSEAHERCYGYCCDDPVELVNFRISAIGDIPELRLKRLQPRNDCGSAIKARRMAYFHDRYVETPVYERGLLAPGQAINGPAIIEQLDSTIVLQPGDRAEVDQYGNIMIEV